MVGHLRGIVHILMTLIAKNGSTLTLINEGKFLMGSSKDEKDRFDNDKNKEYFIVRE